MTTDDPAAVQADDELLDELFDAIHDPDPSPKGDARLMQTLMAWQREVNAEPLPILVGTDTALAAVATGRHRRAGFWSQLRAALARDRWPWRTTPVRRGGLEHRGERTTTMWTKRNSSSGQFNRDREDGG